MKIYLAGTTDETTYRKKVHDFVFNSDEVKIIDPMIVVDQNASSLEIVETDIELISICDLLIVIINRYTAGSIMEMVYAKFVDIPVYAIISSDKIANDPWLIEHYSERYTIVEQCLERINYDVDNKIIQIGDLARMQNRLS